MRLNPIQLTARTILPNRLVVPPMASGTADVSGFATERTLNHYQRLAKSGAGLVFVEYTYVHESGRSEEFQLGADSDQNIVGLAKIAEVISAFGAVPGLQLTHAGGKSTNELAGGEMKGPSSGIVPSPQGELSAMIKMDLDEIKELKDCFVKAALRAQMAGFKIIELHAAHGYGLNQWLSPLTNRRDDLYGGCPLNRARILIEIVKEVRRSAPDLVISLRFPGSDLLPGGMTTEESQTVAVLLEDAGVNLFNVSSGIGGWRRPNTRRGEGYLVDEALSIKKAVSVPVIGVGGIRSIEYIEKVLGAGIVDLVAVGRAILEGGESFYSSFFSPV